MKLCTRCNTHKPFLDFHKNCRQKDGYQTACKDCCRIRDAKSYSSSPKRRVMIKATRTRKTLYNRALVSRYKRFCGCYFCKEKEPVVLDLHHKNPKEKENDPSTLVNYSTERLRKEIRKCLVVCSNCHRKLHAGLLRI